MTDFGPALHSFVRVRAHYVKYCLALLRPGHVPTPLNSDNTRPGDMQGWAEDDLQLLVDEARRQLDGLLGQVDKTRDRAQYAFITALSLLAVFATQLPSAAHEGGSTWCLAFVGALTTVYGLLGALSLMVVHVNVAIIHAGVLSQRQAPILRSLAEDYAEIVGETNRAGLAMLTVYREAALYITLGAAMNGLLWLQLHA